MTTKKVKSAGRYGSRYGVGIRKRVVEVESQQKAKHTCPKCHFPKVKRISRGIFRCKKCNLKFAGGTYVPSTLSGSIINKMVTQKGFATMQMQLQALKDKALEEETAEAVEEAEEEIKENQKESKKRKPLTRRKKK